MRAGTTTAARRKSTAEKFNTESQDEFRIWLKGRLEHIPQSLNAIEAAADIRGNALGKFLRGERGGVHGLTPLNLRRLAPVLGISEETLLARGGHLSQMPGQVSVEAAILADDDLDYGDKKFLIEFYNKLRG